MLEVVVSAKGLRRVQQGHPWVFASDVRVPKGAEAGIARLYSAAGELLGSGFYNPHSKIALRLVTRGAVVLGAELVAQRLERAAAYRRRVCPGASGFRAFHSEADGLSGLTVDVYHDVLVVQQHAAALEGFTGVIVDTLSRLYAPKGILARNDSPVRGLERLAQETKVLCGNVPERVVYQEGEVTLSALPYTGQKTGAYLDQRENHVWAGQQARARALDVCTYHGGFALQLAHAGAEVTAVDASEQALAEVQHLAGVNGLELKTQQGNAFEVLRGYLKAGEVFDTVVLDPPSFAKGRTQVAQALKGYHDLHLHALKLLDVGGQLYTASCSHHIAEADFVAMLRQAAAEAGRELRVVARRGAAPCHPEVLTLPESRYLNFFALEVQGRF